ncbi:MAG: hypothetical protein R6T99_10195 [Bacteroidales bacterium]
MKNIPAALVIFALVLSFSCKSTQETTQEETRRTTTPPKKNHEKPPENNRSGLNVAEVKRIQEYAKKKAELVCKINKLQEQPVESEQDAMIMKENIIQLEDQLNKLNPEIENFLNRDELIEYFNKAYQQELYRCTQRS